MTTTIPIPRKHRTRQHVIADLSVNYGERFILEAGHTTQPMVKDYGYDLLWMMNRMPVILVLFEASRRRAYWLHIQGYFQTDLVRRPKAGAKTTRVHVPARQAVNRRSIAQMRAFKQAAVERGRKEKEA